jgi:NRPS condensation-like uncharacterized protein
MQTTPLNVLDELYLHLNLEEEPWSVHLEVRVEGRIDAPRLRTAVGEAALAHPIARARLADARATDVHYRWEIAEELASVDLEEIDCDLPADLSRGRERLLSRTPDLDRPGPFSLLLAHDRQGDVLVMNLHHAAGDGLSALRLIGSIARAYAGEEDPVATVDALEVRDVSLFALPSALPTGLKQRMQKLIPLTGNLVVDTATLSNLGRLPAAPSFGDAGAVNAVWFSPPGRMPLGASLGVATLDERLFLTLRYRHALFDANAATEFLATPTRALSS